MARPTRAYSLPASVVPVLLGTVLAPRGYGGTAQRHCDGTLLLVVLLGSILAHWLSVLMLVLLNVEVGLIKP